MINPIATYIKLYINWLVSSEYTMVVTVSFFTQVPTLDRCTPPVTGYIVIISFNGNTQNSRILPVNTTSILLSDYFSNYLMRSKTEYDVYIIAINNISNYIPDNFSAYCKELCNYINTVCVHNYGLQLNMCIAHSLKFFLSSSDFASSCRYMCSTIQGECATTYHNHTCTVVMYIANYGDSDS